MSQTFGMLADWQLDILACPICKQALMITETKMKCSHCAREFGLGPKGQPDLRLTESVNTELRVIYNPFQLQIPEQVWELPADVKERLPEARKLSGRPQVDIKAWLLNIIRPGQVILDLGSKSNRDQKLVEDLGARYVAVEINNQDALILGDAHAIPLLDNSVDVVLCMSVFEHLKNPFLAVHEIQRILKPGGFFVGIVGFLEGVHGLPHGSYFHHSYLGIYTILNVENFQVHYLYPGWKAIRAISYGMLPGLPKMMVNSLIAPLQGLQHILWYILGIKTGNIRYMNRLVDRNLSASFHFVAQRNG